MARVRDVKLDAANRRQAVALLLGQDRQAAVDLLLVELRPTGDPSTQQVIAEVLAADTQPPPNELANPLMTLFDHADEGFLIDLASVVGRYEDNWIVRRLSDSAADMAAPMNRRRGAIMALANNHSQPVVRELVRLLQPNQPEPVRTTTMITLANLTGINGFTDAAQWQQWWDQNRHLDDAEWMALLLRYHAKRADNGAIENRNLENRVVELQRQLYRATSQEARSALLITMLSDPLEATRRLAIDLIIQRLTDAQPITPAVREALLSRLDDASPAVRQGTARILRELADPDGADIVARLLVDGQENNSEVLRAYLLVLARVPRQTAVEKVIQLLDDPNMGPEAAAAVSKAIESQYLTDPQEAAVSSKLHEIVARVGPIDPRFVELFSRLAKNDEDWKKVAQWLGDKDPAVRAAAAAAWAQSSQPLDPLVKRADDQQVFTALIDAATRRGGDRQALLTIINHRPQQDQAIQAWRRCLLAMAARIPTQAAVDGDRLLAQVNEPAALRDPFLSTVIGRVMADMTVPTTLPATMPTTAPATAPASVPSVVLDLLLARGELRLSQGDPNQALLDFRRVAQEPVTASAGQRTVAEWGMFRASLAGGDADGAFERARLILSTAPTDSLIKEAIAKAFLGGVERSIAAGQAEVARKSLRQLRVLIGSSLPAELEKITVLERRAAALLPPPATAPAQQPSTTMPSPPAPTVPPKG